MYHNCLVYTCARTGTICLVSVLWPNNYQTSIIFHAIFAISRNAVQHNY